MTGDGRWESGGLTIVLDEEELDGEEPPRSLAAGAAEDPEA